TSNGGKELCDLLVIFGNHVILFSDKCCEYPLHSDPNIAWKEREQVFKMAGQIVRTMNITQSAIGKSGKWTTVVACGVFIPVENIPKSMRRKG
ncbi:MAG: hypothetical protein ABI945_09770, partial [Nitrospirales bacterium]